MGLKNSIRQGLRSPRKLMAYFFVIALVCTFLCIGVNLRQVASQNLTEVLENFNVLALPDFTARINRYGQKVTDPTMSDTVGFFSTWAENYDLDVLEALPGVKHIDVRNQFGAYVANAGSEMYYLKSTQCPEILLLLSSQ